MKKLKLSNNQKRHFHHKLWKWNKNTEDDLKLSDLSFILEDGKIWGYLEDNPLQLFFSLDRAIIFPIYSRYSKTVWDLVHHTNTVAIGGGECVEEFIDKDGNFLFEVCYENGTRCSSEQREESIREGKKRQKSFGAKRLGINKIIASKVMYVDYVDGCLFY